MKLTKDLARTWDSPPFVKELYFTDDFNYQVFPMVIKVALWLQDRPSNLSLGNIGFFSYSLLLGYSKVICYPLPMRFSHANLTATS